MATATPTLPPGIPPWPVTRYTVERFEKLVAAGAFDPGERVELIRGWVRPKMTMNPPHNYAVMALNDLLSVMLVSRAALRVQQSLRLPDSVPEPDFAVCVGLREQYRRRNPGPADIHFLIEVSDSSLDTDTGDKLHLYAENGIPEYWVVNIPDGRIEVYTGPSADSYAHRRDYGPGEAVPVAVGGAALGAVPVAEVLP